MSGKNNDIRKNGSGYYDPTAYRAIVNCEGDSHERMQELLQLIFDMSESAGFTVENRIVLKDVETGRVWK